MPYKDAETRRNYQAAWTAQRRQDWIDSQGGKCVACGSTENLEVDHIDPLAKTCDPGRIWNRSQEFRDKELANCQVLCADCHLTKTITDRQWVHGESGYQRKCRCDICVNAHNRAKREYRQRKRDAGLPYK